MSVLKSINKRKILLFTTLICLVGLIALQVVGIFRAADMQELQFKHSVDLALRNFSETIERDKQMYTIIEKCGHSNATYKHISKSKLNSLSRKEIHKVDSVIRGDLSYFGIELDFKFDIVDRPHQHKNNNRHGFLGDAYYYHNINKSMRAGGLSLKVEFPKKRAFLAAQIGPEFISALLLISFTFISFFMVYRFYKKEQVMSSNMKDFINNMTHELKTPLASISFSNNLILKNPGVPHDKLLTYSRIISEETNKLNTQVEELLQIAKIGQNKLSDEFELIAPNQLIENARKNLNLMIEAHQAQIELDLCPDCGTINGHKTHLVNSFVNIIENAIKYSVNKPAIKIISMVNDGKFVLKVIDNGIGIAKEHINFIFDRFYRVSHNDRHDVKGFGLGLFYVKTVIGQHNGLVDVQSAPGRGSEFTISLPLINS